MVRHCPGRLKPFHVRRFDTIETRSSVKGTTANTMEETFISAKRLVGKLRSRGLYITSVESCTGGGFANVLTDVVGASDVFCGAFVCYCNEQKVALGVPADVIERFSVYSVETAVAMAEAGMRTAIRADIGVGITGSISRVDPENPTSHPGKVYIAVVRGDAVRNGEFMFTEGGDRSAVKERIVSKALEIALEILD